MENENQQKQLYDIYEADLLYMKVLKDVMENGFNSPSRNHHTLCKPHTLSPIFTRYPLVTIRRTAGMKSIEEYAWFLTGDPKVPENLLDWWKDQVCQEDMCYHRGYGQQLRQFEGTFDQVRSTLDILRYHPYSRRMVLTTWNPREMVAMASWNGGNTATPSCCHTSYLQINVDTDHNLYMLSVSRSSDMLLGITHNFAQKWAFGKYLAYHSGYKLKALQWVFGNAHIYTERSHMEAARQILSYYPAYGDDISDTSVLPNGPELIYDPKDLPRFVDDAGFYGAGIPPFRRSDFRLEGEIPQPKVTIRPVLL